jgi:hypothetical protein
MSQLLTLIWLKWSLFRNSLRSSKAIANRLATLLGMLAALALAFLIAVGLGVAAYALTSANVGRMHGPRTGTNALPSAEFFFFSILALCYLLWSTLPLSIGSSRQFDPGNLLLYPVSLRKLFALDFISEIFSLQGVFAIPAILALGIGAGLARGNLARGLVISVAACFFGLALSKWISISVGSLIRKKRTSGESLLAWIGVTAGLGGALFGQIAPVLFRHSDSISILRWTPPGAVAYSLTDGLRAGHAAGYTLALFAIVAYTAVFMAIAYSLSRRSVLGGGRRTKRQVSVQSVDSAAYTGWEIPLLPAQLSAVIEKELRYLVRNAQVRTLIIAPLMLVIVRFINRRHFGQAGDSSFAAEFMKYGEGLMATSGILYVFLILAGLFANQFALEHAGMRTLILSPVDRKTLLLGKNIATSIMALVFSAGLLLVNELVFRDITWKALFFSAVSFSIFAPVISLIGNFLSIRFPRRMKFGKRLNSSGVSGLLMVPTIFVLILPPLAVTAAGYLAQSLLVEYVTLALLAAFSVGLYGWIIGSQGDSLKRRELEILEAVNDPGNE